MKNNDFELAAVILRRIARTFGHVHHYSWSDDYCIKSVKGLVDEIKQSSGYRSINPYNLSNNQLETLGFSLWDDGGPMLIPLWIVPFLDGDMKVKSISGEIARLGDVDTDERFGCIAYGIPVKQYSKE